MSIEVMKQALEALESVFIETDILGNPLDADNRKISPAIAALRQAIEAELKEKNT